MTADEASLIPEKLLRPWVNHEVLEKPHMVEVENLEKALILCTPYKIGPFQSEIDRKLDMSSQREKFGLGPMPKKEDLVRELLRDKPLEMARPLGDAYSEYFLKKQGLIDKDAFLEEGWDKEKLPTQEELLNPETEEDLGLEFDDEIAELLAAAEAADEEEKNGESKDGEEDDGEEKKEEDIGEEKIDEMGEMTDEMMIKLMEAELDAERLKTELMEQRRKERDSETPKEALRSPRGMPADIRKKYIEKLEKLAKEALGESPKSKYVPGTSEGIQAVGTPAGTLRGYFEHPAGATTYIYEGMKRIYEALAAPTIRPLVARPFEHPQGKPHGIFKLQALQQFKESHRGSAPHCLRRREACCYRPYV